MHNCFVSDKPLIVDQNVRETLRDMMLIVIDHADHSVVFACLFDIVFTTENENNLYDDSTQKQSGYEPWLGFKLGQFVENLCGKKECDCVTWVSTVRSQ